MGNKITKLQITCGENIYFRSVKALIGSSAQKMSCLNYSKMSYLKK